MRKMFVAALVTIMMLALPVMADGRPLGADLSGANEVTAGDPDGTGQAELTLNQGQGEICWSLETQNVESPTRAHIHSGVAGVNGPIVVTLYDLVVSPPVPVATSGCTNVDPDVIKEIRQNPEQFYVNVHNAEFPAGAIRGQLTK
jgi:hypothetical protein